MGCGTNRVGFYHHQVVVFLSKSALQTIKLDVAQIGAFNTFFSINNFGINSIHVCMVTTSEYSVANNT